jgi:hypothetical protein
MFPPYRRFIRISTTFTSDYQEAEPYFLPPSHPAFSKLTKIFTNVKKTLVSRESFKDLGFVFLRVARRRRSIVSVATHSSKKLSDYIFKFYIPRESKKNSRLTDRCRFSRRAQKVIKEMHLEKYFFVPKKYLFPLKKLKGEKLNRFILVEDKISLLEKDDFIRFWRSNKIYEYLLPVAKLLWHSRIKDLHPSNLKRNENGKMSLFDTEFGDELSKASFIEIDCWLDRNKKNNTWNHQKFRSLWKEACREAKKEAPLR